MGTSAQTDGLTGHLQLPTAFWDLLERATVEEDHPCRLMALSTIDEDGHPDARLMVVREIDREGWRLSMHCDRHSAKVAQIIRSPRISLMGYDGRAGIEVRMRGEAAILMGDDLSDDKWGDVASAIETADPNHDLRTADRLHGYDLELSERLRDDAAVIRVRIDEVEWLQFSAMEANRFRLRRSDDWFVELIPPV